MLLKSKVLIVSIILMMIVLTGSALAATPERNEMLIADILTGRVSNPGNFNLWVTWVGPDKGLQQLVVDPLWMADYVTGEIINVLASEAPEYNDDFTELTIRLRDSIDWNDGEHFTADDVVYTVERIMEEPSVGAYHAEFNMNVENIYKTDDYTVVVELKEPNSRFHYQFLDRWGACRILPKHVFENVEDITSYQFDPPVGTGPYKLVDYDQTGYWFLYERREDWDRTATGIIAGEPAPKYVEFHYYGDASSKVIAMANNDLDMADLTPEAFEVARDRNEYVTGFYDSFPFAELHHPATTGAAFNTAREPFDNREVRWALNLALDAQELAMTAYNGAASFSPAYIPAILPHYDWYYDDLLPWLKDYTIEVDGEEHKVFNANLPFEMAEAVSQQGYDVPETEEEIKEMFGYGWWKHSPEIAEKLLEKNGFTRDSDGNWLLPDGTPWSFEIISLSTSSNPSFKWAFPMANQWREFGIDVEARPTDQSNVLTNNGDFDVVGGQPAAEPFGSDPDMYRAFNGFHSDYYRPPGEQLVGHQSRWHSEEMDSVLERLEKSDYSDPKVIDISMEAAKILIDAQPGVSLASFPGFLGANTYYWENYPSGDNPYAVPWYHWPNFKFVLPKLEPTGRK